MRRMYVDFTKMFTLEIYFQHNDNVESKQALSLYAKVPFSIPLQRKWKKNEKKTNRKNERNLTKMERKRANRFSDNRTFDKTVYFLD